MPVYLSKGHSISQLDSVRAYYKSKGVAIRIRYRGPRYDIHKATCLKKDATSFAVYPR